MSLTVEATYENGVLKPTRLLPLKEHAKVQITILSEAGWAEETTGVVDCTDPQLIEWAARDPELDFPPPPERP